MSFVEGLIYQFSKALFFYIPKRRLRVELRNKTDAFFNKLFHTKKGKGIIRFEKEFEKNVQMSSKYKIYSLGTNCYARVMTTAWGLKPRKKQGEVTLPFDISIHPLTSILKILNNSFQDYFDDIFFDGTCWTNKKYNIKFVHDCVDDKEAFITRFQHRIENFYDVLNNQIPTMFVCTVEQYYDTKIFADLFAYLQKMREDRPFKLLIINYSNTNIVVPQGITLYSHKIETEQEKDYMKPHLQYTDFGFNLEYPLVLKIREELNALMQNIA